ncbi:unnamed protein product [Orchesella dallaii]|uniref:Uncharacterized protein n=1 Tax=Orchesella dallaii TaxID=48710 RepID=A0ABP1RYQ4_9HEXA
MGNLYPMVVIAGILLFIVAPNLCEDSQLVTPEANHILKLFPQLNTHWEQYIVYFYRATILQHLSLSPSSEFLPRSVVIRDTNVSLNEGVYRYSNQINVVISPLKVEHISPIMSAWITIEAFMFHVEPHNSVFLFVQVVDTNPTHDIVPNFNQLSVFPALKAIVSFPSLSWCNSKGVNVTVICNGYCETTTTPIKDFELFRLGFYTLHKSLFSNANSKLVPSMVTDMYRILDRLGTKNIYLLLSKKHLRKFAYRTEILAVLTIREFHNLSITISTTTYQILNQYQVTAPHTPVEHILFAAHFSSIQFPTPFIQQLRFNKFDTTSIIYCDQPILTRSSSLKFTIWYNPFTFSMWMSFISVLVSTIVLFSVEFKIDNIVVGILKLVATLFRQEGLTRKRYIIIACGITFLSVLYENSLLSIMTIVPQPKGYANLKELLDGGFKIMFNANLPSTLTPRSMHGVDFNISNLFDRIDDSFIKIEKTSTISELVAAIQNIRKKLAMLQGTMNVDLTLSKFEQTLRVKKPNMHCYKLKQVLSPELHMSKINTENRFWISQTLHHIVQSGLFSYWDALSDWRHLLKFKKHDKQSEWSFNPDYINLSSILPILIVWSSMLALTTLIFCAEILSSTKVVNFRTLDQTPESIVKGSCGIRLKVYANIPFLVWLKKPRRDRMQAILQLSHS